jgi:hypothetical protein
VAGEVLTSSKNRRQSATPRASSAGTTPSRTYRNRDVVGGSAISSRGTTPASAAPSQGITLSV